MTDATAAEELLEEESLNRDIKLLVGLLGQTLARHEGDELLNLVERVRALSKGTRDDSAASTAADLDECLQAVDLATATLLVRAFSAYFHLANIAEQVHRADERTQLAE